MNAIVLAAGKGMRFAGQTNTIPKVLQQVGGKPMLRHVLENIAFIPQENTAIVVGYGRDAVLREIGGEYRYPVQPEQIGTGDAIRWAEGVLPGGGDDVLVCYGDMPLLSRETYEGILAAHRESGADCTVLTAVAPNSGLHYGRVLRENGRFSAIREHGDCTPEQKKIDELNIGVCVFKAPLLFRAAAELKSDNSQREYFLTDVPKILLAQGKKVETYTTYNSNEIYGVNTPDQLLFCDEIFRRMEKAARPRPQARWFGTGGWRGLIGEDFIKPNVQILAQAIADDMRSKGWEEIVIGYDRRFLSDKAAMWAAEVFAANGVSVYFISRIAPTPLVMFTVWSLGAKYGIAITASHNPADYNGVKVFTEGGRDASAEVTEVFEKTIARGVTPAEMDFNRGMSAGRIHMIDPNNDYMDRIISMIDMDAIRGAGLRVLIDPMFGVSKTTLQTILMTARCDVDIINDRHDALFGGRLPSPTAATLSRLRDMVVEKKYNLGIATDGDADRIGIIDNEGRFVHPNEIMILLYYYLLHYRGWRGDCVRNLATTHILDAIAADFGQVCHEVPVGFKHISAKMEQTEALIGGESSGGLTIRGHIRGKDGIFASVLIVEMLCRTGKTVSELLDEIGERYGASHMAEFDASFTLQKKEEMWKALLEDKLLPDFGLPIARVNYMDGCKVYFQNGGWIITRFSGTEPLLRIFCEMPNKDAAETCVGVMREFLGL